MAYDGKNGFSQKRFFLQGTVDDLSLSIELKVTVCRFETLRLIKKFGKIEHTIYSSDSHRSLVISGDELRSKFLTSDLFCKISTKFTLLVKESSDERVVFDDPSLLYFEKGSNDLYAT